MSENLQYSDETIYHFKESLIEMAVCLQLQKDIGTITYGDLRTIQEIRIVGMQIYQNDDYLKFLILVGSDITTLARIGKLSD